MADQRADEKAYRWVEKRAVWRVGNWGYQKAAQRAVLTVESRVALKAGW